jgi:rhodanese-related sulfurtransferase
MRRHLRTDPMEKLVEFAAANAFLVAATALMLIAVIVLELRLRARADYEVSIAEAIGMINQGAVVVDLRQPERFAAGHIVDAVNMTPAELEKAEEGKIKKKRGVLIVCDNGAEGHRLAKLLRAAGFDGAFSLAGGLTGWRRENQPLVSGKR